MTRYLWHFDPDGWPLERIDTNMGEHVPVVIAPPDESDHSKDRDHPIACRYPKAFGEMLAAASQ
jgi:hypothetical protein